MSEELSNIINWTNADPVEYTENTKKVLDLTLNKNHNFWIDNMDQ